MVWTIILAITFFVYRETPIGKSTDLVMTMFHFIINLLLHTTVFCMQHLKPSSVNCVAIVVWSGLTYNLFVSVTLVKSHKLLKAFTSTNKASEMDRRITVMQQRFTIALLIGISGVLVIISLVQEFPLVVQKRNTDKYLIYIFCSNHLHIFIQMAYGMVLQIACFVTAYRCRNLPNVFNESMSVYSVLVIQRLTTVITSVMFVVQAFQKDPLVTPLITWIVISLNTVIFLVFLYARKVYIMIFRKEKNSLSYIQKQTFDAMKNSSMKL